jgi:hypothetical protein
MGRLPIVKRRYWSTAEETLLLELVDKNVPISERCRLLNRTRYSVIDRLDILRHRGQLRFLMPTEEVAAVLGVRLDSLRSIIRRGAFQGRFIKVYRSRMVISRTSFAEWCQSEEAWGWSLDQVRNGRVRLRMKEAREGVTLQTPEEWARQHNYSVAVARMRIRKGELKTVRIIGREFGGYLIVTRRDAA